MGDGATLRAVRGAGGAAAQPVRWRAGDGRPELITIDIPADLNAEDETGLIWTFLDEAADPEAIEPGAIVVAGSELTPAVCEVVDLVEKAVGVVVHLRLLPGTIDQYRRLVRRIGV